MKKTLLLITAFMVCLSARAQSAYTHANAIDSLFHHWDTIASPGCAIGVVENGQLVYARGYGSADLEHDVPLTPQSVFYMASVSKHFVTFCILLLEEQGKLDMDAPIQTYLPDFPDYGHPLTIRHFIHHTSGVRDYLTLMSLKGQHYLDDSDPEEVYELIKRQSALNFTPGEKYLYSNSCYFMLAMIVERVTGKSIKEFANEHMFAPLKMANTHFHDDNTHIIPGRAFSYSPKEEGGYNNIIMRFDQVGSGGLYSTVEDMYLWDQNFYDNKLGNNGQLILDKLHSEGVLNNGDSIDYAFGLENGEYRGLRTVSHGGSLAGYRTFFLRFPDQNCSIIFLGNRSDAGSSRNSFAIADIVLQDVLKDIASDDTKAGPGPAENEYIALKAESLAGYEGLYVIRPGVEFNIQIVEDSLQVIQLWNDLSYKVIPVTRSKFVLPDANVYFSFENIEDGMASMMVVDQDGSITECKRKIDLDLDTVDLAQFVGKYYSPDLECTYEIYLENGELMIDKPRRSPMSFTIQDLDSASDEWYSYYIIRENNRITGISLDAGRVQNLDFEKVD